MRNNWLWTGGYGWPGEVKRAQKQPGRRAWRARCQTRGARLQNVPSGGNRQSGRCENTDGRPLLGMRDLFA
ncbi:hypothetical protein [Snodgrassella sp. ESL0253]|uniref:hypothetical protein n=1 Tax=Snodgrassella sp. ESL0253 TaxID=2705031 RepID=UPI001581F4B4|nr:hypothetical protein [Snodgrassella sp. ESL0253]NUE66601.1 hypothetical protein [Snodgrassella sp. ESL0253]